MFKLGNIWPHVLLYLIKWIARDLLRTNLWLVGKCESCLCFEWDITSLKHGILTTFPNPLHFKTHTTSQPIVAVDWRWRDSSIILFWHLIPNYMRSVWYERLHRRTSSSPANGQKQSYILVQRISQEFTPRSCREPIVILKEYNVVHSPWMFVTYEASLG